MKKPFCLEDCLFHDKLQCYGQLRKSRRRVSPCPSRTWRMSRGVRVGAVASAALGLVDEKGGAGQVDAWVAALPSDSWTCTSSCERRTGHCGSMWTLGMKERLMLLMRVLRRKQRLPADGAVRKLSRNPLHQVSCAQGCFFSPYSLMVGLAGPAWQI